MRELRVFLSAVGLLVLPAAAAAGPIWFSVRTESSATPDANGGAGNLTITSGQQGRIGLDPGVNSSADIADLTLSPRAPAHPDWEFGESHTFAGDTRYSISIELTDEASGESGTVHVTGSAHSDWLWRYDGRVTPDIAWLGYDVPQHQTLTLGANRYTVTTTDDSSPLGDDAHGSISLSVTSLNATPEPGSLALGGLGLAVAGIARRRWRG